MEKDNNFSVGIVLVNYNGEKYLNQCVNSLLNCDYKNISIIIVDNASKDNSMKRLDEEFNDSRIYKIMMDDNYGIATGNNTGIKKSIELKMDFTLLLNNDTEVEPNFLNELVSAYEEKCLIVPKMFYYDDKSLLCFGGGRFIKWKASAYHLFDRQKDTESNNYPTYCNYAPTTCMLIKNDDFKVIGFMDDDYFLYYDDVDFVYRALKNKYKIKFCPKAVVYHKDGLSTGGKESVISVYYNSRNKLYFVKKHKFPFYTKFYARFGRFLKAHFGPKENRPIIKKAVKDFKKKEMGKMK